MVIVTCTIYLLLQASASWESSNDHLLCPRASSSFCWWMRLIRYEWSKKKLHLNNENWAPSWPQSVPFSRVTAYQHHHQTHTHSPAPHVIMRCTPEIERRYFCCKWRRRKRGGWKLNRECVTVMHPSQAKSAVQWVSGGRKSKSVLSRGLLSANRDEVCHSER